MVRLFRTALSKALFSAVLVLMAAPVSSQQRFVGDEVLSLASTQWQKASQSLAVRRLKALLTHLQIDHVRAQRYGDFAALKFIKAEEFLEIGELADAVLVARRGAKIAQARNLIVIANGEVEIAFASSTFVVTSGSIRISHETGPHSGGIYVTRSNVQISHGNDAIVYAVRGAEISSAAGIVAYNTDVKSSYFTVTSHLRGRLFRDEPLRSRRSQDVVIAKTEPLKFGGDRCAAGIDIEYLERQLPPMARREAACAQVESAFVRCESSSGTPPFGSSKERWIFQACGKKVEIIVVTSANTRSIAVDAGPPAVPRITGKTLTTDEHKAVLKLFNDALASLMRGDIVEARDKYYSVLLIDPDHQPAQRNLATIESQIIRADAAAAPHTAVISKGQATARTYADRGLAYIGAGDMGRGLSELDFAARKDGTDLSIQLDRAEGYLRADRLDHAANIATELIAKQPRLAKAYELRAWAHLLANRGADAYKDAFSSLTEVPPWTPDSFAREKAAYRVMAGYFALRQTAPREKATDWLREWRPQMKAGNWPDAYAMHLLGLLDEHEARRVAAFSEKNDRGKALGEAAAFAALEAHFAGDGEAAKKRMIETFTKEHRAGYTLGLLINKVLTTPSRKIQTRQELERAKTGY